MPNFQVFRIRSQCDDIGIRQFMAWYRCRAYMEDGSGGAFLYKRTTSASYDIHIMPDQIVKVRAQFGQHTTENTEKGEV